MFPAKPPAQAESNHNKMMRLLAPYLQRAQTLGMEEAYLEAVNTFSSVFVSGLEQLQELQSNNASEKLVTNPASR